ncbi:MAG: SAM-dependent methyltransferase [Cyclobacteriaceae bacterium]|nr:N-6 DNA methylase [Cyclobacteriaceae bacterium]MCH8517189.1 SAM-dependent methyltransferase [Cyclobacteriaceae bacterium]
MIIEDLKSKGITSTEEIKKHLSKSKDFFVIPDNLAKLTAQLVQKNKAENCIDISANLGEILSQCEKIEDKLGLDANAQNIELAKHLNPNLKLEHLDPLNYDSKTTFDTVICFPPLGQRIDTVNGKLLSEQLYLEKSLELLSDQGTAIFILPNNILRSQVFSKLRTKILLEHGLETVISVPKRMLKNVSLELSILVVKKHETDTIKYYQLTDPDFTDTTLAKADFSVPKKDIAERWDYNFHNPKKEPNKGN